MQTIKTNNKEQNVVVLAGDGELNEGFRFTEIQKFMDELPTKIFDEVFEKYKEMIDDLEMDYSYTCPNCQTEEVIDYSTIPNLLWA